MALKSNQSDIIGHRKDLDEEAMYLEERIKQMGFEGDCAYERAMYTFYLDRLCELRSQMTVN